MTEAREFGYWRFCVWMGPTFMAIFIVFWGIMGHNIPPWNADVPAATVANWFRTEANTIRTGMVVGMTFAVLYAVWGLGLGRVMTRIVPRDSILVDLQVWGAGLTVVPIMVSCVFWLAGAYRPEALDDSILQLLYDTAWLLIDMGYMVTTVQMVAMGVAFLKDRRAVPLVPKWLAWYGIWVGFSFVAEVFMPFFKSGIFARSGTLNFWVEFFLWFFWIVFVTTYLFSSIKRLEAEARGATEHAHTPAAGVGKAVGASA